MSGSRTLALVVATAVLGLGCGPSQGAGERSTRSSDVLARVNGVPITAAEVRLQTRSDSHGGVAADEKSVLESVIRDELAAQRAAALRLELGPEARAEVERAESQLAAVRRKAYAEAYDRDQQARGGGVTDSDARKYFDEHAEEIRTELHVRQLLLRDEGRATQLWREIDAGASFEEVARKQFADLPAGVGEPWELGYLRWNQIPDAWRPEVPRLQPGQTSGVIAGPRNRYWIVKLVDRRVNSDITFEGVKPVLVELLRTRKSGELRANRDRELRERARVVYERRDLQPVGPREAPR